MAKDIDSHGVLGGFPKSGLDQYWLKSLTDRLKPQPPKIEPLEVEASAGLCALLLAPKANHWQN